MPYKIKERTPEEIESFKARHEGSEPKPFLLVEVTTSDVIPEMVLSNHDTREEAEAGLKRWIGRDLIGKRVESFRDLILEIAGEHGLDRDEAILTAKEALEEVS